MGYNTGEKLRTFLAFDLPAEVTRQIADIQRQLAGSGLQLKWVRPENVHLTVKFLGDIPKTDVDQVSAAAAAVTREAAPMNLRLKGLGVFPGMKRPRVLWAGLTGDTRRLIDFHQRLDESLAGAGFPADKREFTAHLTIARLRQSIDPRRLAEAMEAAGQFPETDLPARQLTLYKSDLQPSGAVYTVLRQFSLGREGSSRL